MWMLKFQFLSEETVWSTTVSKVENKLSVLIPVIYIIDDLDDAV